MTVDTQLIEAAQRGDAGALDSLLIRCAPDLRRYARHYCATAADAEERTVAEIASSIGALPETVKTRIARGRKLIREHLLA